MRIWLSYLVLALLMFFVAGLAVADLRMEVDGDFTHFVIDPDETDNEYYAGGSGPNIWTDGAGNANGYSRVERQMPCGFVAFEDNPWNLTYQNAELTCTMVESNGTAYTSDTWVRNMSKGQEVGGLCAYEFELACFDGVQAP